MAACRSCRARIHWARTTNGKAIPLDAEDMGGWDGISTPPDANVQPTGERVPGLRDGETVMVVEIVAPGEGRYRSHFASCPHANKHRRNR